jgi:hypothetical protein
MVLFETLGKLTNPTASESQNDHLSVGNVQKIIDQFESLNRVTAEQTEGYFKQLGETSLEEYNCMLEFMEKLRYDLHQFAAKAEEGKFDKHGKNLKALLVTDGGTVDAFFRKAGGLKKVLTDISAACGSKRLIYFDEVQPEERCRTAETTASRPVGMPPLSPNTALGAPPFMAGATSFDTTAGAGGAGGGGAVWDPRASGLNHLAKQVDLVVSALPLAAIMETQGKGGDRQALQTTLEKLRKAVKAEVRWIFQYTKFSQSKKYKNLK